MVLNLGEVESTSMIRHPRGKSTSNSELPLSPAAEMPEGDRDVKASQQGQQEEGGQPGAPFFFAALKCGRRAVSIPYGSSKLFSLKKRETSAVFCLPFASLPWAHGEKYEKYISGRQGVKL